MTEEELLTQGYEKIDDNQFVKKVSENVFEVYDIDDDGAVLDAEINLDHYSDEDIKSFVSGYYDDLDTLKRNSGNEWKQVLAEIIAEQLTHAYEE